MKQCKIIQDLFPSYIDDLTNETTNQYIEEHLKECKECREILENMRKELKLNTTQKTSKEVKYIKKFNKKMKILKIILLSILLIFILSYVRKMIIIVCINNKISDYINSTNYYRKEIGYWSLSDDITTFETFVKDGKYIMKFKHLSENDKITSTDYYNGETVNRYTEIEFAEEDENNISRKTAELNDTENILFPVIFNQFDISNPIMFFGLPLFTSITSEKSNEIDCYRIELHSLGSDSTSVYYIDKETGLIVRCIGAGASIDSDGSRYDMISDFKYKFNCVTEEDFIEPNINEYEIYENTP